MFRAVFVRLWRWDGMMGKDDVHEMVRGVMNGHWEYQGESSMATMIEPVLAQPRSCATIHEDNTMYHYFNSK